MSEQRSNEEIVREHLGGADEGGYGDSYRDHSLEQYKLYVESAERISDRRQSANSFFLSSNTLLVGALGALYELSDELGIVHILIGIAGVVLSFTWSKLVHSYRQMNSGKFALIHDMERRLPYRLYHAEWEVLQHGVIPGNYIKFTVIESFVTRIFIGIHLLVIGVATAALIGQL